MGDISQIFAPVPHFVQAAVFQNERFSDPIFIPRSRGARIEHVCGNPTLGPEKDRLYGLRIVRTAFRALETPVAGPTLFDPAEQA